MLANSTMSIDTAPPFVATRLEQDDDEEEEEEEEQQAIDDEDNNNNSAELLMIAVLPATTTPLVENDADYLDHHDHNKDTTKHEMHRSRNESDSNGKDLGEDHKTVDDAPIELRTTTTTTTDALSPSPNSLPEVPSSPSIWAVPSSEEVQAARQGSLVVDGCDSYSDYDDEASGPYFKTMVRDDDDQQQQQPPETSILDENDGTFVMLEAPRTSMGDVDPWAVYSESDDFAKMEILKEEPVRLDDLQIGDHVYQWRSWIGIPGVFQHHGIVLDIQQVPAEEDDNDHFEDGATEDGKRDFEGAESEIVGQENKERRRLVTQLTIADFSNIERLSKGGITSASAIASDTAPEVSHHVNISSSSNKHPIPKEDGTLNQDEETKEREPLAYAVDPNVATTTVTVTTTELHGLSSHDKKSLFSLRQQGTLRVYPTTNTKSWYKVQYEAPFWKRQICRAGTCTSAKSDPVGLVLARVHFILNHPHLIPAYHVLYANCECVAVWCKTGHWSTLQARSVLEYTAAGQAKSATTLAAAAAHTQVTVPASGVWGWLGYTTKMSLLTAQPMIVPALAGYGIVTVGAPALLYHTAKKHWRATTLELQAAFWEAALESPDDFSENLMSEWSRYGS
jgi:hypothetical protein